MKSFINKEVSQLLNMKPGTVAYYTNKGFVKPEVEDPKGRGTTRRYSCRNLVEFLMILELQKHGFTLSKIKEILYQAKHKAPAEQFERWTGSKFKAGFNLWDGLNFDSPLTRSSEVFIIIYDDDKKLEVKFNVMPRKKTMEELKTLAKEDLKKAVDIGVEELRKFEEFCINMDAHDSAVVINVSKLWHSVMKS